MIESVSNKKIIETAKLKQKKYQDLNGKFLIEGKHLVEEADKYGYLDEVFVLNKEDYEYKNMTVVNSNVMKKLSSLDTIPNIIGVSRKINNGTIKGNILILDNINNPGNMGTILRSSAAFDVDTIIISSNSCSIYNPKVLRASEGLIYSLNIIIANLDDIIPKLKDDGYTIYTTDVDGGTNLKDIKFEDKPAIIMGNEGNGVSDDIKKYTDKKLYIEMNPKCESLNVGIATSIILYKLYNKR